MIWANLNVRLGGAERGAWRRHGRGVLSVLLAMFALAGTARAESARSAFAIAGRTQAGANETVIHLDFSVPPDHVIYADRLHFETADGAALEPVRMASPEVAVDKATGKEKKMFHRAFDVDLRLGQPPLTNFVVRMQGCSNSACYFPETRTFHVAAGGVITEELAPEEPEESTASPASAGGAGDWRHRLTEYSLAGKATGYMSPTEFTTFTSKAQRGELAADDPLAKFKQMGLLATLCLIVLGGAGLNLTPCVLPLIPINLAIIGAGASARSRRQGFIYGAIYGAGMAVVYGLLGLGVVLTGSKFGSLNSSVGFNLGIAVVFLIMALAMFDVFTIDFSRFSARLAPGAPGGGPSKARWVVAFSCGAVAALLAGACVAPVVISVLLLATQFYAKGVVVGLFLPFLLGLGMALPWPFAGASLTLLPKPGRWMTWVKYGFGVVILGFTAYYAHLGVGLYRGQQTTSSLAAAHSTGATPVADANEVLSRALAQGRAERRPVFIDFHASWCKNCLAMEETVFNQAEIQTALKDFIVVKYAAERPNETPAKEVLDRLGVMGLPTYVVLAPN